MPLSANSVPSGLSSELKQSIIDSIDLFSTKDHPLTGDEEELLKDKKHSKELTKAKRWLSNDLYIFLEWYHPQLSCSLLNQILTATSG